MVCVHMYILCINTHLYLNIFIHLGTIMESTPNQWLQLLSIDSTANPNNSTATGMTIRRTTPFQISTSPVFYVPPVTTIPMVAGHDESTFEKPDTDVNVNAANTNTIHGLLPHELSEMCSLFPLQEELEEQVDLEVDCLSNRYIKVRMGWCIDHLILEQSSQQVLVVVQQIITHVCTGIFQYNTPWSLKLSRLYVLNDILMSTSSQVHHIVKYRSAIEEILPRVMEFMGHCYRTGVSGRMSAKLVSCYSLFGHTSANLLLLLCID